MTAKRKEESEDIEITDDEEFAVELGKDGQLKKLREKLKKCQAEKVEYLTGWQRAKADYVNQSKEHTVQLSAMSVRAKTALIEDLLPALDSFNAAMRGAAWQDVDEKWRIGVEHIHRQIMDSLEGHKLEELNPLGEEFDPAKHQAVKTQEVNEEGEDNQVIEVQQLGYLLDGQLIRPAQVTVGSYSA